LYWIFVGVESLALLRVGIPEPLLNWKRYFASADDAWSIKANRNIFDVGGVYPDGRLSNMMFIGATVMILGIMVRYSAQCELGKYFTWEMGMRRDHKLVTSGMYRFVRHPAYTGLYAICLGVIGVLGSRCTVLHAATRYGGLFGNIAIAFAWLEMSYPWLLLPLFVSRAKTEDAMLRKEFGIEWEEWAVRTPYMFLPGVF